MDTVKITFADGTVHEYSRGTTFYEMSKDFPMENIMAVKIDNEVYSLDTKVFEDAKPEFINTNDIIGNKIYKAGLKFLFEVALIETFPELEVSFEHSVPRGMLGVVEGNKIITQEDLQKIKHRMDEIVNEDAIIQKLNISPKEAIKYYLKFKEYEKADNIQSITDRLATLYKLHKKLNYFYSIMPYSTGSINKYELVYLGKNRIVFIFPTVRSNGEVPEYVHYANIIDSFFKGKKWLENLHMPYISNLNKTIGNGKIKDFIKSNE